MSIELTVEQARALAGLAEREGPVALHQLGPGGEASTDDVYATPRGSTMGFRIAVDGTTDAIGETLPAAH